MLPERSAGILLPMTSLPSRYGIGDMGEGAYRFIDFLKNAGQRVWQMLPVTKAGGGNSPYYSLSSFTCNPLLIDLEALAREGLLSEDDLTAAESAADSSRIDYDAVMAAKLPALEKAAECFFRDPQNCPALADEFTEYKAASPLFVKYLGDRDILIQLFFDRQWRALKDYAHEQGILLVGDIPIYVAPESDDMREHPELFQLDENGYPSMIAGVPPDYFSETGQVWNNPVYDWGGHSQELTHWWIRRIKRNLELFDLVRLDHFRGFESYWVIPAGAETAIEGHWEKGPGIAFFDALRAELGGSGDLPLIAEDLGDITDAVRQLLADTGLPGMKVLQFAFGAGDENDHLPHNYRTDNCICYTGTHDNDTILGWFEKAQEWVRGHAMSYLGCEDPYRETDGVPAIVEAMIRAALRSRAALAVVPMQDVLSLGTEARMNIPGKSGDNWSWRVTGDQLSDDVAGRLRRWTAEAGRLK